MNAESNDQVTINLSSFFAAQYILLIVYYKEEEQNGGKRCVLPRLLLFYPENKKAISIVIGESDPSDFRLVFEIYGNMSIVLFINTIQKNISIRYVCRYSLAGV